MKSDAMLIPASDFPRRNHPCPCGSGKKFKKCCMGSAGGADYSAVAVPKPGGPKPQTLMARAPLSPGKDRED